MRTYKDESELRAEIAAWLNDSGPMPNPFKYATLEGEPVGTIPVRVEPSYEDFWATATEATQHVGAEE